MLDSDVEIMDDFINVPDNETVPDDMSLSDGLSIGESLPPTDLEDDLVSERTDDEADGMPTLEGAHASDDESDGDYTSDEDGDDEDDDADDGLDDNDGGDNGGSKCGGDGAMDDSSPTKKPCMGSGVRGTLDSYVFVLKPDDIPAYRAKQRERDIAERQARSEELEQSRERMQHQNVQRKAREREAAKLRKRKQRAVKYANEIIRGERHPDGRLIVKAKAQVKCT